MRGRTKQLAIAVALTIVDVVIANYYCAVIWQAFARDMFARAALLGLLCLWIATAVVIWLHVAYDVRQILQERDTNLALDSATAPAELRRRRDV